jgi:hypothetical protein
MCSRCFPTVAGAVTRTRAISEFVFPSATHSRHLLLARGEPCDLRRFRRLLANEQPLADRVDHESLRTPLAHERAAAVHEPVLENLRNGRVGRPEVLREKAPCERCGMVETATGVEEDNPVLDVAGVERRQ